MIQLKPGYQEFISERKRARSPEVDFGVNWLLDGRRFPPHRVSWIRDTGELYVREQNSDNFAVLTNFSTENDVEAALNGWTTMGNQLEALIALIEEDS